jgi:hypothetical protein
VIPISSTSIHPSLSMLLLATIVPLAATTPGKVLIVIVAAVVSIPLLTEDHSMLVISKYISSVMTKLLESEQFLRIMSVMPKLMLSLASIRKVVELY